MAEATGMIDLSGWPDGSPADAAQGTTPPRGQLAFTNVDGMRVTAL